MFLDFINLKNFKNFLYLLNLSFSDLSSSALSSNLKTNFYGHWTTVLMTSYEMVSKGNLDEKRFFTVITLNESMSNDELRIKVNWHFRCQVEIEGFWIIGNEDKYGYLQIKPTDFVFKDQEQCFKDDPQLFLDCKYDTLMKLEKNIRTLYEVLKSAYQLISR